MPNYRNILVTREEIVKAGGVRAAVAEALSLAALGMTPRAMTAYEAVGMTPSESDGKAVFLKVEVQNEEELREAVTAGADAVALMKVSKREARRLCELAKTLQANIRVKNEEKDSPQR